MEVKGDIFYIIQYGIMSKAQSRVQLQRQMKGQWCHLDETEEGKKKSKIILDSYQKSRRDDHGKIFAFLINVKAFWQVQEQIWHNFRKKYEEHEYHGIDGYSTICELLLYLEQNESKLS